MKVFHVFVMCVNKWQNKCTSVIENDKLKPLSNCVVENILEYHKTVNLDLEDDFWERDINIKEPPRYLPFIFTLIKKICLFKFIINL